MYAMLDLGVLLVWCGVGSAGCDHGPRQIRNYCTPYWDDNRRSILLSIAPFLSILFGTEGICKFRMYKCENSNHSSKTITSLSRRSAVNQHSMFAYTAGSEHKCSRISPTRQADSGLTRRRGDNSMTPRKPIFADQTQKKNYDD